MYSTNKDRTKLVIYQPTIKEKEVVIFNEIIEKYKSNFDNIHIQHDTLKTWAEDTHFTSIKITLDEELVNIEKRSKPYSDFDIASLADICEVYSDETWFIEKTGIVVSPSTSKYTDEFIQDIIKILIKNEN